MQAIGARNGLVLSATSGHRLMDIPGSKSDSRLAALEPQPVSTELPPDSQHTAFNERFVRDDHFQLTHSPTAAAWLWILGTFCSRDRSHSTHSGSDSVCQQTLISCSNR